MRLLVIAVLFVSLIAVAGCKKSNTMTIETPGGKTSVTMPAK